MGQTARFPENLFPWDRCLPLAADASVSKKTLSNRAWTIQELLNSKKIESRHFALTIVITKVSVASYDP
jgi:hypothetical protein